MKYRITSCPRYYCLVVLLLFCFFSTSALGVTSPQEVEALRKIAAKLGKKTDWDFNFDPCTTSGIHNWTKDDKNNAVVCNCTVGGDGFCHVTGILLKSQNLAGTLPLELTELPYLSEIDLTRNYLNGTIPPEWGTTQLTVISVFGNRLTGTIPQEIGNISTLQSLDLEFNQFYGNLPPELGNLTKIERLLLNSNNFTGELPTTLAKLTALQEFVIGDNQFSGKIPDFIQNWTSLETMRIIGSGLSGPIPSAIFSPMKNLTELIITDLNGSEYSPLPLLDSNFTKLEKLMLRNCNINGTIPHEYLENMTALKIIDLSYNNVNNSEQQTCSEANVNLFASSSMGNNSGMPSCPRSDTCSGKSRSLYINCGGGRVTIKGSKIYEGDDNESGPARFRSHGNWAFSSTGYYMDNNTEYYTCSNQSRLSMTDDDAKLYMNARVAPISLTYYAFCLENGRYKVNLHFAEIMFTDDQTYSSLGRRLFDVYIQEKRVLENFNIAERAGGAGKKFITPFAADVTNNSLEIRFYWAGKGTTALPYKSVYGPLISAISVESDFPEDGLSTGAVVGIVVAAAAFIVILLFGILWWRGCIGHRSSLAKDLQGLDLRTGIFTFKEIKAATNNFNIANKIGEGGFGPVYKGILPNGTIIAVKQLSTKSKQGNREFVNEIGMISALQHPYLVRLYGCCVEGDQLLLIYEFMENNSLARALFGSKELGLKLDWPIRHKICVGIASGLAYLHEESRLKIVHRDIKATNVLLDEDLNPKISDFGLAKLVEEDNTHISTRIAGTYGYMAPEYAMHGYLTDKADVYSFGIVALEIVSGRINTIHRAKEEAIYLLDWARILKEKGELLELVDPRLGSNFDKEQVTVMIQVALLCTNITPALRPTMSSVVSMLEGKRVVEEIVSESSEVLDEKKLEVMRRLYKRTEERNNISEIQHGTSVDEMCAASSTSASDLYPLHLDSSYWDRRDYH
ncbi:hypothetical protein K1719_034536 [Acacia pycnantha]|nr:hypothetical protein K1719_034536 [Acacia pycnantha]